jgi:hypothetical protein
MVNLQLEENAGELDGSPVAGPGGATLGPVFYSVPLSVPRFEMP